MDIFSTLLRSQITRGVKKEKLRQKVPRKLLSDGPSIEIYKRCGWTPPSEDNDRAGLNIRRKYISDNVSKQAMTCLDTISASYEQRFIEGLFE